jgi:hypothetical protein
VTFSVLSPFVGGGTEPITCGYSTTQLSGNASNTGSLITFSSQDVNTLQKTGSSTLCPAATATAPAMIFSAVFGPLTDTSVTGNPDVFVN